MVTVLILKLLSFLSLIAWLSMCTRARYCLAKLLRIQPNLDGCDNASTIGTLAVVLAARNEQSVVGPTIHALLRQSHVNLRIIAVDDWSSDGTREILDRIAGSDDRLTVLHDPILSDGWLGKQNALHQGVATTEADFLLFIDADSLVEDNTLVTCLKRMQQTGDDMVALFPKLLFKSPLECSLVPAWVLTIARHIKPSILDPQSKEAFALGAFILIRADAYNNIGGHKAIRDIVLDDIGLAKAVKHSGMKVSLLIAPDCVSVRQYRGFYDIFNGLVKNVAQVIDDDAGVMAYGLGVFSVAIGLVASCSPFIALAIGDWLLFGLGLIFYAAVVLGIATFREILDYRLSHSLAFPLAFPLVGSALIVSMYHRLTCGGIRWRNRTCRISSFRLRFRSGVSPCTTGKTRAANQL